MDLRVRPERKLAPKHWCFWTVVLEKTLESLLDCREIQPVNPKGNQSQIFIGRTDAEAKAPVLKPPDVKNWLIGKDPDAGQDWRWEEKGTTKDEMVGWHYWLNGPEFEKAPGVGDGQRSRTCYSPWGHKESDMTEQLDWTELVLASIDTLHLPPYSCWTTVFPPFAALETAEITCWVWYFKGNEEAGGFRMSNWETQRNDGLGVEDSCLF